MQKLHNNAAVFWAGRLLALCEEMGQASPADQMILAINSMLNIKMCAMFVTSYFLKVARIMFSLFAASPVDFTLALECLSYVYLT